MLKKTILIYLSLIGVFVLLTISCDLTIDDCGPFPDRFKTTGFESDLKKVAFPDSSANSIQLTPVNSDTISFDEFAIQMIPDAQSYIAQAQRKLNFSIWSKAYACSPPILISDETVTDIQIFSDINYSNGFSSQDNIASLFDIIVYYDRKGYQRFSFSEFISSKPEVPAEIILLPNAAPSATNSFQFTVKYFQKGLEMDEYEFTTESIVIKN